MDYVVLGNGVSGQPFGDLCVVTFSWKCVSEHVSTFTSLIDFPYLVCQPEAYEPGHKQRRVPTAADSTHHCRCWRDLLPRPCCGVDVLCQSNQWSLRSFRHGQPMLHRSLKRRVTEMLLPVTRSRPSSPSHFIWSLSASGWLRELAR